MDAPLPAKDDIFQFPLPPIPTGHKTAGLAIKAKLKKCGGSIRINADRIRPGMIQLGANRVSIYPNNGISLEINGDIVFHGTCYIGNGSFIAVDGGRIEFGDFFNATAACRIVCHKGITFGRDVLIGWENMICDSDFHKIQNTENGLWSEPDASITIGNHVWIANSCSIMKGSVIPDDTIVAAHSLVNKKLDTEPFSLVAGCPASLKKKNVTWKI